MVYGQLKDCLGKAIKKIIQVGHCHAITLPREYLKAHNLKQGDFVEVFFNSIIHVEPLDMNEIKLKLGKTTEPKQKERPA